ncbi:CCNB1 protein, partial [Atrichornis clamosus]|nr:CCNB1 protein [Atrichornis clamosus]
PAEDILCEAFSSVLLESEDLDMKENDDPNMCSSYVKDIYKYLRHLEENRPVTCKYLAGEEINGNMQATLINWLVQVQMKFSLHQETLYLTVAIIYHFLQDNTVFKMKLPLVGVTAMFIASKYEEVFPPCIRDFSYVTNYTCLKFHIRKMESKILKAMDFCLGFSLPLHFLKRASRTPQVVFEQYVLAKYLMELCIVNYDMVHFCPSRTAAAAFCLSLKLLSGWKLLQYLQQLTSYTESDILPVMQHMAKNVVNVNKGATKQQAILKKYATEAHTKISTIEQLDSSIIWELAKPLVKN